MGNFFLGCESSMLYFRMEEIMVSRQSLCDIDDDLKGSRRSQGSGGSGGSTHRRSFFRRRRHQRNNSKDSREMGAYSDVSISSDSTTFLDGKGSK